VSLLDRFIFAPEHNFVGTPAQLGLPFDDVNFTAADGTQLHGWYVRGQRRETLLWFHGNAGNISHRLDNLRLLHTTIGVNVFIFDYRGYGRSQGIASEPGVYDDARGALAYLRQRPDVAPERIIYFGRSLGSAVALELARRERPLGLVLETPFLSIRAMARSLLPLGPLALAIPEGFDNESKITEIDCPVLIIHGDRDEIVPFEQGQVLFERARPPKSFYRLHGAGHNDTYIVGGAAYFARLGKFIDAL